MAAAFVALVADLYVTKYENAALSAQIRALEGQLADKDADLAAMRAEVAWLTARRGAADDSVP